MKIKFVTCIYNNLYGSEIGGRASRFYHYRLSLISLLRMTNADFLCYTSKEEIHELKNFFYNENKIPKEKLKFKIFDLNKTKYFKTIKKFKNIDEVKQGERCYEIQYNKFFWLLNEDWTYDYYFWIDSGLSHIGLLPPKYLSTDDNIKQYYDSTIFDNFFLDKVIEKIDDKIFLLAKENLKNFWSYTVPSEFYVNYDNSLHIVGGMFGGKKELMKKYCESFKEVFLKIIKKTKKLWYEENLMTLIYFNQKDLFYPFVFDTWWHEESGIPNLPSNYFEINKSFYKILEEIKEIK